MNCPNCGAAIKEGKFCNYCGAKLPEEPKIDVKKRDYRISFNNESSIKKAEIDRQEEAERQEFVLKMTEKLNDTNKKNNKQLLYIGIFGLLAFLLMYLLTK